VIGYNDFIVDALNFVVRARGIGIRFHSTARQAALATAQSDRPDVVLIDVSLKGGGAVALSGALRQADPTLRTLALGSEEETKEVNQAAAERFDGFLSKSASLEELADSILGVERTSEGIRELDQERWDALDDEYDEAAFARTAGAQLTFREHEVLVFLVRGASSDEIAKELDVTRNTLRTHIQNMMMKLQVHTRLQAVIFAVRHGLVEVPDEPFTPSPDLDL
jgi:DNA-binding NarL/FixJ family response regulator